MKSTVFIATSLDGFIARPDGGIDWLTSIESAGEGEDYGYAEFMKRVDFLVMGRNTFDLVRGFEPWPYGKTRLVVLSSGHVDIPEQMSGTVEAMSASPEEVVRILEERGARQLYIDGGKTIQGFLEKGLIDEMIITRIPILIGNILLDKKTKNIVCLAFGDCFLFCWQFERDKTNNVREHSWRQLIIWI